MHASGRVGGLVMQSRCTWGHGVIERSGGQGWEQTTLMVSDIDFRVNIWISFGFKDKPRNFYGWEDIGPQLHVCFRILMDKASYCVEYIWHNGLISLGWLLKRLDHKGDSIHLYLMQKQERHMTVSNWE